jgi:hypothetical protein
MHAPSRRLTAASLVAAGLLMLAGMIATPWETEQTTRSYLEALGAHPEQGELAAVLLHLGFLALVPAVFGLVAAVDRGKLRAIGGTLAVLGAATLPGLLVVDFYAITIVDQLPIEQAVAIEDAAQGMTGAAVVAIKGGLGVMAGLTLLGIAAARTGFVGRWVAVALPVGWILPMFVGLAAGSIAGAAVILVAFAALARGIAPGRPARAGAAAPAVAPAPAAA